MQHRGRRETFALGTPNRAAAAGRAKEIFLSLQATGWEGTLAKLKPGPVASVASASQDVATVGGFIAEVKARASVRERTFEEYAKALRKIVADPHGIDGGRTKLDHTHGGHGACGAKACARRRRCTPCAKSSAASCASAGASTRRAGRCGTPTSARPQPTTWTGSGASPWAWVPCW